MSQTKPIRRIAIIGTGVIGASWSSLFLAKGLQVVATDIAPNAEAALQEVRGDRLAGAQAIGPVARSVAVEPDVHGRSRAGARRRRPRPGERARADRFQAEALWAAGRAAAARRDHRVELVGAHHERNPEGRRVPSRALRHRPSVQSAPLDPAGRDRRRGKDLGSDNPARRRNFTRRSGSGRCASTRKCRATSPTASRPRWRARSITSLPRAS